MPTTNRNPQVLDSAGKIAPMNLSQRIQWSVENNLPDEWWICLDGVTEEQPVSIAEVRRILSTGEYTKAQILHVFQTDSIWTEIHIPRAPQQMYAAATPPTMDAAITTLEKSGKSHVGQTAKGQNLGYALLALLGIGFFVFILQGKREDAEDAARKARDEQRQGEVYERWNREHPQTQPGMGAAKLASEEYTITGDSFTGYVSEADHKRAIELASDPEAHSKFFLAGALSHRATLFKKGEIVQLEDIRGTFGSSVKVRRKGELVSYWTPREAIMK